MTRHYLCDYCGKRDGRHELDRIYAELLTVFDNDASAMACLRSARAYGRSERDLLVDLVRILADEKRASINARVRHAEVCAQPIIFCANPACVNANDVTERGHCAGHEETET